MSGIYRVRRAEEVYNRLVNFYVFMNKFKQSALDNRILVKYFETTYKGAGH